MLPKATALVLLSRAALGMPELIADSLDAYEAMVLRFAREPGALAALKEKLALQRDVAPFFDTTRFVRHLESAFVTMWERRQRGEHPSRFEVARAS
jgi:protein O-GlcNAc transferase